MGKNLFPANCQQQWTVVVCFDNLSTVNAHLKVTEQGFVIHHLRAFGWFSITLINQSSVMFSGEGYLCRKIPLTSLLWALNPRVFACLRVVVAVRNVPDNGEGSNMFYRGPLPWKPMRDVEHQTFNSFPSLVMSPASPHFLHNTCW